MNEKILKYLIDIQEAISHINAFTSEIHSFLDYENSLLISNMLEQKKR